MLYFSTLGAGVSTKEKLTTARKLAHETTRRLLPIRLPRLMGSGSSHNACIAYTDARVLLMLKKDSGLHALKVQAKQHFDSFFSETEANTQMKYRTTEYLSNTESQFHTSLALSYIAANPRERAELLVGEDALGYTPPSVSLAEYRASMFGLSQQLDALQAIHPMPYQEIQEYAVCFGCCFLQRLVSEWRKAKEQTSTLDDCGVMKLGADLTNILKSVSVYDAGWKTWQEHIFDSALSKLTSTADKHIQTELWKIRTSRDSHSLPVPSLLEGALTLADLSPSSALALSLLSHSSSLSLSFSRALLKCVLSDANTPIGALLVVAAAARGHSEYLSEGLQEVAKKGRCARAAGFRIAQSDRVASLLARVTAVARERIQHNLKERIAEGFVAGLHSKIKGGGTSGVLNILRQGCKDAEANLKELGKDAEIYESGVVRSLLMGYFSSVFLCSQEYLQIVERIKIDEQSVIEVLTEIDLLCERECRQMYQNVVDGLTKPYSLCQAPLSKLHDQEMVRSIINVREKVTKLVRSKKIPTKQQHMYCPLTQEEIAHLRTTHHLEVRRTSVIDPDLQGWTVIADPLKPVAEKKEEKSIKLNSHNLSIQSQLLIYNFVQRFRAKRALKRKQDSENNSPDQKFSPELDTFLDIKVDEERSAELFNSYLQASDAMKKHFLFGSKLPTTDKHVSGFKSAFGDVNSLAIDPREHKIKLEFLLLELATRGTVSQPGYDWYKANMRNFFSRDFSPR